jgi:hypothetical protein
MSMRELKLGVDHAKRQRSAKCKARRTENMNRAICASLVEEICTGVGSKAGVEDLLNNVWEETQATEACILIRNSQGVQSKLLGLIEKED